MKEFLIGIFTEICLSFKVSKQSTLALDHANSNDAEDEDGGSDNDDVYAFKSSIPERTSNSDSLKRKSISSAPGALAGGNTKGKTKQSSSGRASYEVDSDAGSGYGDEEVLICKN